MQQKKNSFGTVRELMALIDGTYRIQDKVVEPISETRPFYPQAEEKKEKIQWAEEKKESIQWEEEKEKDNLEDLQWGQITNLLKEIEELKKMLNMEKAKNRKLQATIDYINEITSSIGKCI